MIENFCCSTSSPALSIVSVLGFGHFSRCVVVSHWLRLHFLHNVCGTHFHMVIFNLFVFFSEVSVKVFGPFFNWVVCLFIVEFKMSLYILDNSPLSIKYIFCKYFLWLVFPFSWMSFPEQNILMLMKSSLLILSFMDHAFGTVFTIFGHLPWRISGRWQLRARIFGRGRMHILLLPLRCWKHLSRKSLSVPSVAVATASLLGPGIGTVTALWTAVLCSAWQGGSISTSLSSCYLSTVTISWADTVAISAQPDHSWFLFLILLPLHFSLTMVMRLKRAPGWVECLPHPFTYVIYHFNSAG